MTDLGALASTLGELLKERKETLAVAESSAGGLISAALLRRPFLVFHCCRTKAGPQMNTDEKGSKP